MSDKMKKEFEAFAGRWRYDLSENENGFYENATTQRVFDSFAWAWQASRQRLAVKLPCWSEYDSPRQYMDATQERLNTAGVSYE